MSAPTAPARDVTEPPLPPMGTVGFLRWAWRQLTSMRTALVLLFLLAIASVPGSILPQRGTNPIKVSDWIAANPVAGPVLDRLGFFDVYASPWFAAVYLLLFVSLVGCVIPRARLHWRSSRMPPPAAPRRLERLPGTVEFTTAKDPREVIAEAREVLRHWRRREPDDVDAATSSWVSAERGYLRETGNLVFHLSLLVVLVGVAMSGLLGWKGTVLVKEGDGFANTLTQYDAWGGGRLVDADDLAPFSFTLDRFTVDFERTGAQRGAPRDFDAAITYRESPTSPPQSGSIEVNHPLDVDGARIYLVGHGYAPHLVVRDASGAVVFDDSVVFLPQDGNFTSTGVVKIPDAPVPLGITGLFLPTAGLDAVRGPFSTFPGPDSPALFLSAFTGDLGLDDGVPRSVYSLDTTGMTQIGLESLVPGDTWTLPDGAGSVEFTGYERWASFQVSHDPGGIVVLVGVVLALAGLLASLFLRRRRVWVKATPSSGGGTLVQVAGLVKGADAAGTDDVSEPLADVARIAARLGAPARDAGTDDEEERS